MSTPPSAAPPRHAVIVLAAGASRRLGTAKQLLEVDGETLLHRAARIALETVPTQALVVLGAEAAAMRQAVADLEMDSVVCDDWQRGQSASLRVGVAALQDDIDGVLVLLCDQIDLSASHANTLLQAWHDDPSRAVASAYADVIGVPAVLPRSWFAELLRLEGDRGARDLLRRREAEVVKIVASVLARDIDMPLDAHEMTRKRTAE